jgi:hypothetical protein
MSSLDDLARYIQSRRAAHDRAFQSDVNRLRIQHGVRIVDEALDLAKRNDQIASLSISGARRRERQRVAGEAQRQRFF